MKLLQKICFVLLLTTFSSAYGGDCVRDEDDVDCRVKAEQGHAGAQNVLGLWYYLGQGVLQDYKEAVKWYRKSAEQGYASAQYNLGVMYYKGQGVIQDYKQAFKWCRKSAFQGIPLAQHVLGLMYVKGQGVVQDYKESVRWHKLAAEQGLAGAQYRLGVMYYNGKGVIKDYVMAHMYWNIAAVSDYKKSKEYRDSIEKEMTVSQLAEAQKLAREWIRKKREEIEKKEAEESQKLARERDRKKREEIEKKSLEEFDFFKDVDTSFLDESEEKKTENSSPEKDTPTKISQTINSSSNQKITVDKTHSKNNETAIVKGTVKTFLPYLLGYLFFFFVTKRKNPFSKPVDVEQRPKWLFSLIVGMSFGVYGTSGVGIDSGDFLGYLVIKSAFFFIGVIFATLVFFIYRWKVRRNLS